MLKLGAVFLAFGIFTAFSATAEEPLFQAYFCESAPEVAVEKVELRVYYRGEQPSYVSARAAGEPSYSTRIIGANDALDLYGTGKRSDFRLVGEGPGCGGKQRAIYLRLRAPYAPGGAGNEIAVSDVICSVLVR